MYMRPLTTSRMITVRLPPPDLPGGIKGSISCHSSLVKSLGYRNLLRSYRPRFSAVHIGDPPRIRPPPLNHNSSDRDAPQRIDPPIATTGAIFGFPLTQRVTCIERQLSLLSSILRAQ